MRRIGINHIASLLDVKDEHLSFIIIFVVPSHDGDVLMKISFLFELGGRIELQFR